MSGLFGGNQQQQQPQYLPPPPPPPTPTLADFSKNPGASSPSASLIGGMGGTNATGGSLNTETTTTRKSLLGD